MGKTNSISIMWLTDISIGLRSFWACINVEGIHKSILLICRIKHFKQQWYSLYNAIKGPKGWHSKFTRTQQDNSKSSKVLCKFRKHWDLVSTIFINLGTRLWLSESP